jgi:hypothetical protein
MRAAWLGCCTLVLVGGAARAQDPYEIQVYAADILAPGTMGAELHLNYARATPADHAAHFTLEPHLGLAPWCEVGMYFTSVLSADGRYDFSGVKLRYKAGLPRRLGGLVGLALNAEFSFGGGTSEEGQGFELRPIIDLDLPLAYLAFNPIVTYAFAGQVLGFEPAAKASAKLGSAVQLGLEYYGGLDLAPTPTPASQQAHRLFGVVDLEWQVGKVAVSLDAGVGWGFSGTEKLLVKAIVGVDFS